MEKQLVFAFDLGTSGFGECVRKENDILHLSSLLMPAELGSLKEARRRRRQLRTRIAHRKREEWWRTCALEAGIEVLETRQLTRDCPDVRPDPRMLREFPASGDATVYTSSLLRIALLRGHKLESWQVFKAIWSALQRRGYDSEPPWKGQGTRGKDPGRSGDARSGEAKEEKENKAACEAYGKRLDGMTRGRQEFAYPCCLEAYLMGIWHPDRPDDFSARPGTNPSPARNKGYREEKIIAPRSLVEKELKTLLENAAAQYPGLKGKEDYILYGPGGTRYASWHRPEFSMYRGREWDWQGLLGQKIPRFNNRCIASCRLIPRFNVCRADDPLNLDVTFLMKLKNLRYFDASGQERGLTPEQIRYLFEKFRTKRALSPNRDWEKYVKEALNGTVHPAHTEVEKPKTGGRSSFSRPALRILKHILLTGKSPRDVYTELLPNTGRDPKKGFFKEDLAFLLQMPKEWDRFHIPDERYLDAELTPSQRKEKIREIIGQVRNSVVRHRLSLFHQRLLTLQQKYGTPERVVIELVRDTKEGFLTARQRKTFLETQKRNRQARERAKAELPAGVVGQDSVLKMQLFREQNSIDLLDPGFRPLEVSELDGYEIEHIVPLARGGSDAYINKVLTRVENNQAKSNRTPYEWLHKTQRWQAYLQMVACSPEISERKKALMTSENALELVERYEQLAGTAYVARLSQRIAALTFGWPQMTDGSQRHVRVVSGGLTAKVRRQYRLDELLHPHLTREQFLNLVQSGEIEEKNRDNPLHHALDALVVSVLPHPSKVFRRPEEGRLPDWFGKDFCEETLAACVPVHLAYKKPVLAETIYARRIPPPGKEEPVFVTRFGKGTTIEELKSIEVARKQSESIFDPKIRADFMAKLEENPSPDQWRAFVENYAVGSKPRRLPLKAGKVCQPVGKMEGQYFSDDKEHKAQLVYRDQKGRWRVEPVFASDSLFLKTREMKKRYGRVYCFQSGQVVILQEDTTKLRAGAYILKTLCSNGTVALAKFHGEEVKMRITELMERGRIRPYREER